MKKKVIAIVCAVAVLAAAGGGVTWHFLGNGTKEDDNVVYVNTVKALTNLGTEMEWKTAMPVLWSRKIPGK